MNSTENKSESNILKVIANDFELIISSFCFILNILCIIVFTMINKSLRTNGQMYKYLLMKSICDFIIAIIYLLNQYYIKAPFSIYYSFWLQIFEKYIYRFFSGLLKTYSIYFEIMATIDCFLSIENKYKFLISKKAFYFNSFFIFLFFIPFYGVKLFVYDIVHFDTDYYLLTKNNLYLSYFYEIFTFIHSFFRDILGTILLIFFNFLIFLKLKMNSRRKKELRNNSAHAKAMNVEKNKAKMIYASGSNHFLFHFPSIIYNLRGKYIASEFWDIYNDFKNILIILSYTTPFIIYILFNRVFQKHFLTLIRIKRNSHSNRTN
jgi:hypothetical protein